jgi:asparagine synthase (glutamine-hydrolysing)
MCGISGVYNFRGGEVNRKALEGMSRQLIHRGPDDKGVMSGGQIGLANRRLSVIDLETGHQPIHNEDKSLWLVFNGEIYNFPRLRKDLLKEGHRFYTQTDTECLLHLYEEKGTAFLKKLDGMFALALWDGKKKRLLLARDPLGKKPLYWTVWNGKLLFASELKAIFAYPGFKKKLEEQSLGKYFFYSFLPSPSTLFKGVKKVPPGHFLTVEENGLIKEEKYWEIDYGRKINLAREEIKEEVLVTLEEAVRKRLLADVPLGVFLSGGIDSGLIASLMTKFSAKVNSFSLGFEEEDFDESAFAAQTARRLGIKLQIGIFRERDLNSLLEETVAILDEPLGDPSVLPTLFLSKLAAREVKVVLSGDGGDESFAGYPKYLGHFILERILRGRLPSIKISRPEAGEMNNFLAFAGEALYRRNQWWISSFSPEAIKELTGHVPDFSDLERYHQDFNGKDILDEASFLDQKLTLADLYLPKVDRASMSASLEVRCPFLDKALVEYCARIPFGEKIKGGRTKSLLREIAAEYLPAEVINQPKKGFGIPLRKWLAGGLRPWVREYLNKDKIRKGGILNPKVVGRVIKSGNANAIWKLLVFEIWRQNWLKN